MASMVDPTSLPPLPLPPNLISRFVDTSPVSLKFHILESLPSQSTSQPPLILCVHGFPNLAFDWRFILPQLAAAGYHAVALDQRGYGRTHNADLTPIDDSTFRPLSLVQDIIALVHALGHTAIHTLVGHDFGASASSICALTRPDFVRSLVLMSHPFKGTAELPYGTAAPTGLPPPPPLDKNPYDEAKDPDIHNSLLRLNPPRKHYKWYYCTPPANHEMTYPTGKPLHDFLRGVSHSACAGASSGCLDVKELSQLDGRFADGAQYFHLKSADWSVNDPRPLTSWTAPELEKMPHYYVMLADRGMRENVAYDMAQEKEDVLSRLSASPWLPDQDLAVYTSEWARTTFRQPLLWYQLLTSPAIAADLLFMASAKLIVPTKFVSGSKDWGNYQEPGAIQQMEEGRSVRPDCWRGSVLVDGAGHWVNQEKPDQCVHEILKLAAEVRSA